MPINSREKGAEGERELAKVLREHGYRAKRGCQFKGGVESPDVDGLPGVHIECKRTERFRLYDALEQATHDCEGKRMPAVFHRKNRHPWVVVVYLEDFLRLLGGPK